MSNSDYPLSFRKDTVTQPDTTDNVSSLIMAYYRSHSVLLRSVNRKMNCNQVPIN